MQWTSFDLWDIINTEATRPNKITDINITPKTPQARSPGVKFRSHTNNLRRIFSDKYQIEKLETWIFEEVPRREKPHIRFLLEAQNTENSYDFRVTLPNISIGATAQPMVEDGYFYAFKNTRTLPVKEREVAETVKYVLGAKDLPLHKNENELHAKPFITTNVIDDLITSMNLMDIEEFKIESNNGKIYTKIQKKPYSRDTKRAQYTQLQQIWKSPGRLFGGVKKTDADIITSFARRSQLLIEPFDYLPIDSTEYASSASSEQ